MMTTARAVYVVNIDGDQYRRPAENPYVPMHRIKKDITTYFNLDYDFDLLYKGSKILETSSLDENCFDDCTPLVVMRKDNKQIPNKFSEEEYQRPIRPSGLSRQPLATTIHKVLSLNNLLEEDIEDETESKPKSSSLVNEGYHWKPTIIYISPARSVDEEELNFSVQTSANNPLSVRSKLPSSNESIDRTIGEYLQTPSFSTEVQPAYPAGLSMNENSLETARYRSRSLTRKRTTVKLSLQRNSPSVVRSASLARTYTNNITDSLEKLSNTGNTNIIFLIVS
jgi:hypothetical protein